MTVQGEVVEVSLCRSIRIDIGLGFQRNHFCYVFTSKNIFVVQQTLNCENMIITIILSFAFQVLQVFLKINCIMYPRILYMVFVKFHEKKQYQNINRVLKKELSQMYTFTVSDIICNALYYVLQ